MKSQHQAQVEVSLGKTLLGNWVEERQVAHIDSSPKSIKEVHIGGHDGILTQSENKFTAETTSKESYKTPGVSCELSQGRRRQKFEKKMYSSISDSIEKQMNQPPPDIEYVSTTRNHFTKDYTPFEKKSVREHDVNTEEPETFWKQNYAKIHGLTCSPEGEAIFKKNASFSTPIEESKDAVKPGENWST